MPIRRYFVIVGPALAVLLWMVSSYLEPARPVQPQPTASLQALNPAAPAQAKPQAQSAAAAAMPATTGSATPEITASAAAPQPAPDLRLAMPTETTAAAETRSVKASKQKKRKQLAHRRHKSSPTYAYGNPYAAPYRAQYYGGYQPFFGYRW
jgi:hypothetical protein